MGYHAKKSPSASHRWKICTASLGAEEGMPDSDSDASRWGSACHLVSSTSLIEGKEPAEFLGWTWIDYVHPESDSSGDMLVQDEHDLDLGVEVINSVPIDQEQVDTATAYTNFVRERHAILGGEMFVEVRLPVEHITGEKGATGSGDCVIVADRVIEIIDLKGGMVQVDASYDGEPNSQLAMYGGGALEDFDWLGPFDTVRMFIVQPRLNHVSEFELTPDELRAYLATLTAASKEADTNPQFRPGYKQCYFCKAKATCAAHIDWLMRDMPTDYPVKEVKKYPIGVIYERADLIVRFLEQVEAQVRADLSAGIEVMGEKEPLKLIQGNLGQRRWNDRGAAEALLRQELPVHKVYDMSLISPKRAEELLNQQQWAAITPHIGQNRNKPRIVRASHTSPGVSAVSDMPSL